MKNENELNDQGTHKISQNVRRISLRELGSAVFRKTEVRAIYDQGVEAVAATIRQLDEMIEVEDERMHRIVASVTAAHLQKIEQLTGRINRFEEELSNRVRQIHQLSLTVKDLTRQLKEAHQQTRLAKDAHQRSGRVLSAAELRLDDEEARPRGDGNNHGGPGPSVT